VRELSPTNVVTSEVLRHRVPPTTITLKGTSKATLKATQDSGGVVIAHGQFINAVIRFLIVAAAVFILIKQVNLFVRKKEAAPTFPPPPSPEVKLLVQIRDRLKSSG
jgi:large conductance mechanosensitive channel